MEYSTTRKTQELKGGEICNEQTIMKIQMFMLPEKKNSKVN